MKKYLSIMLLLAFPFASNGQVSKQQSLQLVLDSVVGNRLQCTLSDDCGFSEDLLTLCGIGGDVNACQTVRGNFHIERELNVNADSLTIGGRSNLFLFDAPLNVNSNGILRLSDGTCVIAKTGNCRVVVNGRMSIADNVTFRAEDGATLEIVFNPYADLKLSNVTFENCTLVLPQKNVTLSDCTFVGTPLTIDLTSGSGNSYMAKLYRCTFRPSDANLSYAIHVANYAFYDISDCVVERGNTDGQFAEGISVNYCGNFSTNRQRRIHSNHISGCSDAGVLMYNSAGSITMNEIDHNRIGVKLLNNSNIHRFSGDCQAVADTLTQYIHDNTHYEIYMTDNCVPSEFRYNVIRHDGNGCWIRHDVNVIHVTPYADGDTDIDFRYNYWGAGITPTTQLYTNSGRRFVVSPTWVMGDCDNEDSDAVALIVMADSLAQQGENEAAMQGYQQVVVNYSESIVAENALLALLSVGSSLEDLQDYYATDSIISANSNLSALASVAYNQCDIQLQNYKDAIAWYENVIIDTASSYNDSIFARIDLMELCMRMDDNCKLNFGKLHQLIPATHKIATELEHRWLSTIPCLASETHSEEAPLDDAYLPVENLEVCFNPDDNTVSLVWDLPAINSPAMRLSWASGNLLSQFGPIPWNHMDVAQRFDTTDIKPFVGWRIQDVSIYGPYDDGVDYSVDTISVSVWWGEKNGDVFVTEQVFRSILPDFLPNQLYTVALDTNIYIRGDKEVWIGCDYRSSIGPSMGYPWAYDDSPNVTGKGWMEEYYGYFSWSSRDYDNNYAVSSTIVSPDGATRSIGSKATAPEITGFRVYRNGTMIVDMPHPVQTYYVDENPDRDRDVEYCVTLMYDDGTESEPVCGTVEILDSDEFQATHPIRVYPNPTDGIVHIEGTEVYEVRVSDCKGRFLKSFLNSNTIDLSGMVTGVYNLEIISSKDTTVKRIIVE